LPYIIQLEERGVIREQRQFPERCRKRVNDATREQHGVAGIDHKGAKLARPTGIRQVVKQAESRRDHEQPIRELMHVKCKILRSGRETQMHEAVVAPVGWSPSAAFDTRIAFESCINANGMRRTKPVM